MKNYIDKVIELAESLDWNVTYCESYIDFQYYTVYGQDCHMTMTETEDFDTLVQEIYNYYESYDPSEETVLWIDETGHGRNGAPYEIEDILNDMKEFKNAIYELWKKLNNADEEGDTEEEYDNNMNKEQFMNYIAENYNISGEAHRLIGNILNFVANHYIEENEQYNALCELLDGAIGLSDNEIKKIIL